MNDRAAAVIGTQLVPGEELLWAGMPRGGPLTNFAFPHVLSIATGIILLIGGWRSGGFFVIASAAFIVGEIVGESSRRKNTYFGVTDRRAISFIRDRGTQVKSAVFGRVEFVEVSEGRGGNGTVTFGAKRVPKPLRNLETVVDESPMTDPVVFDAIEDADRVASLVSAMLDKRHEEEWDAAVADLSHRSAKSGPINIAYTDAGSGRPIVFLHGVGATKKCWAMQMRLLSRKFRCIALDYRCYGDSDVPPIETISREAYACDVAAVMDAAGIDKAVLCGNSLGGVVALEFYKQFPQRVRSLILVDSFAFYPGGVESIPDRIKTLDDLGIEKFAETRSPALFAPDAPKWLVERARADLASIPLEVYKASTRVTWTGDYRELLPNIKVGALVVWGEHDSKIAPLALSKELMFGIPAASDLAVVPRAGHIPQMEAPLVFNSLLADYLK